MKKELIIRHAQLRDAARIAELEYACFEDHAWSEANIRHDIEYNELVEVIVAEAEDEIIAYENVQILLDECDLRRICVHPEHRRRRLASILLDALFQLMEVEGVKMITLEVEETNEPAVHLYEKMGFQVNGRRKDYYGPGQDALLMIRIGDPTKVDPEAQS